MESMHRGILTHRIPAEGVGGAIFALGSTAILWFGAPALQPLIVFAVLAGTLLAPVLYYRRHH